MPEAAHETPVEQMAQRLRDRAAPLRLVSPSRLSEPDDAVKGIRDELAALRKEVKTYAIAEGERRGAFDLLKDWGKALGLTGAGFLLAKLIELIG